MSSTTRKGVPLIRDNTPEEEAEIQRQIAEDPDTYEFTGNVDPTRRGRPPGSSKKQVTLRIDEDILAALQSPEEKGWQTRLNAKLREAVGL